MYEVADIAIQADGKILAAGSSGHRDFALSRRRAGGGLDRTFAGDGIRYGRFNKNSGYFGAIALQANGRIVVVGGAQGVLYSKFALARYLA